MGLTRSTLLAIVAIVPLSLRGQAPPVPPAFTTSGAFFALSVSNLEATRDWYVEKLGLDVVMQPPPYEGVSALVLEGGGLITHGVFKVGLVVDDLDSTLARLRVRGVPIVLGPFPARDGQRANFAVRDNAGNLIQFFAR